MKGNEENTIKTFYEIKILFFFFSLSSLTSLWINLVPEVRKVRPHTRTKCATYKARKIGERTRLTCRTGAHANEQAGNVHGHECHDPSRDGGDKESVRRQSPCILTQVSCRISLRARKIKRVLDWTLLDWTLS